MTLLPCSPPTIQSEPPDGNACSAASGARSAVTTPSRPPTGPASTRALPVPPTTASDGPTTVAAAWSPPAGSRPYDSARSGPQAKTTGFGGGGGFARRTCVVVVAAGVEGTAEGSVERPTTMPAAVTAPRSPISSTTRVARPPSRPPGRRSGSISQLSSASVRRDAERRHHEMAASGTRILGLGCRHRATVAVRADRDGLYPQAIAANRILTPALGALAAVVLAVAAGGASARATGSDPARERGLLAGPEP